MPVEFKPRSSFKDNKVTDYLEYGTHYQPKGTWSDDSSLSFCLAESFIGGYDLVDISKKFIAWVDTAYWTAHNDVFDCSITTGRAIDDLREIAATKDFKRLNLLIFEGDEYKNGNGSLMRIAPLVFYIKDRKIEQQFEIIKEVSSLTHRHIQSAISCLIYLKMMERILLGESKRLAFANTKKVVNDFLKQKNIDLEESAKFDRLLVGDIESLPENEIRSSGYVLDSLEASIWCVLNSSNYKEAVLKAVSLGNDTDTTACITGALAGLLYGCENMPKKWLENLVKGEEIEGRFKKKLHIRNGVGLLPNGNLLFAISKTKINFYDFATHFKVNGCKNALYLDGFVSRAYLPEQNWIQLDGAFGVIIGVEE